MDFRQRLQLVLMTLSLVGMGSTPQILHAQTTPSIAFDAQQRSAWVDACDDYLSSIDQSIQNWKVIAYAHISIAWSVALMGLAIGLLNIFAKPPRDAGAAAAPKRWPLVSVAVLGFLTASLTGVNTTLLSANYGEAASEASLVRIRIKDTIRTEFRVASTWDDLRKAKSDFDVQTAAYERIVQKIDRTPAANAGGMLLFLPHLPRLPVVQAQATGASPDWIEKSPTDSRFLYFVGKSTDKSLAIASSNSSTEAVSQALGALGTGEPYVVNAEQEKQIRQALTVKETFSTYDTNSSAITYYTLMSIDRSYQPTWPTRTYTQKGWHPIDLTYDPEAGLLVLDREGRVSKVSVDGLGIHVKPLSHLQLRGPYAPFAVSTNSKSIFVSSNLRTQCNVFQYSISQTKLAQPESFALVDGTCNGIAVNNDEVYVLLPKKSEIWLRKEWNNPSSSTRWKALEVQAGGPMIFDSIGQRLIFADEVGSAYSVSITGGKLSLVSSRVGAVTGIAADAKHILFSSGNKVLFYARSDNRGENPPDSMKGPLGRQLDGVAVDASDAAWIIDSSSSSISGPYPTRP